MESSIDFVAALEKYVQETLASPLWRWLRDEGYEAEICQLYGEDAMVTPAEKIAKLSIEIEKASLFDGGQWTFQWSKKYYLRNRFGPEHFTVANPVVDRDAGTIMWQHLNGGAGYNRVQFVMNGFEVQLSDGSWYYPWGEPKQDVPETVRPPSCQHKWVDVGVMHPKIVCYHCDIEKEEEEHVTK